MIVFIVREFKFGGKMNSYIHSVPGRLRIKIPGLKRNNTMAEQMKEQLIHFNNVYSIECNILTGSVTLRYDEQFVRPFSIVAFLQEKGYVDLSKIKTHEKYISDFVTKIGKMICQFVFNSYIDKALKGSPLSYLAVFI